jgi:Lysophospholipase catalytic domain
MSIRFYLLTLVLTGLAYANNGSVTDYAPLVNQPCPNVTTVPLLRIFTPKTQSLHPKEANYINTRLATVIPNEWNNWVGNGSAIGYNFSVFNNTFPTIGLAVSGGGYRAAQYGAGVLSAFDARNQSAKAAGTGGLLQVTSYISALSGSPLSPARLPLSSLSSLFSTFHVYVPASMHVSLVCREGQGMLLTRIALRRGHMGHWVALCERFPDC